MGFTEFTEPLRELVAGQAFFSTGSNQLFAATLKEGWQIGSSRLLFLLLGEGYVQRYGYQLLLIDLGVGL